MYYGPDSAAKDEQQWVVWNGTLGLVDVATLGEIQDSDTGRQGWLDEPYDMVGPFNLDELESTGQIKFAECTVMSQQKWQAEEDQLRRESVQLRREYERRMRETFARYNQQHQARTSPVELHAEKQHREILNLPIEGALETSQIKAAFRRLAQKAHPDVGGSHDEFVLITQARDALLQAFT